MNTKLDSLALGYAGAAISSIGMLILWISGTMGYYMGAVVMMQDWHMFFSLTIMGLIGGIIEAAIYSFIALYLFGWLYNQFTQERSD